MQSFHSELGLWCLRGVGRRGFDLVSAAFPHLAEVASTPISRWLKDVPLPEPLRSTLNGVGTRSLSDLGLEMEAQLAASGIRALARGAEGYPVLLCSLPSAPPFLFHRGPVMREAPSVAIVGSRAVADGVRVAARRFAAAAAEAGLTVVSGGAEGIDTAAHLGAADTAAGQTFAYLASSIDCARGHQGRLLQHLRDRLAAQSEYPVGVPPTRRQFPRRNRLVAGAASAVVVFRARTGSGALYTARACLALGRPLYAVPGDAWDETAIGSNGLIRSGDAMPCNEVSEVISKILGGQLTTPTSAGDAPGRARGVRAWRNEDGLLSEPARVVARALTTLVGSEVSFERLLERVPFDSATLTVALSELELVGEVIRLPGGRVRCAST